MNPGRFFMPGYMGMINTPFTGSMMRIGNAPITSSMLRMGNTVPRGMGLFSRITNGIRSFNWGGLLNNANKTLNVVNQAIPLVRQAGPMFNNMKSMLKIAKAFGSETTGSKTHNTSNIQLANNGGINHNIDIYYNDENSPQKKEEPDNNAPNFFI